MNPSILLFVLGAAMASPIQPKLVQEGLGERFPIVYELPRDNIILGNVVRPKEGLQTQVEGVHIGQQGRPFYAQNAFPQYNEGQIIGGPVRKIVYRQYQNEEDFPIYTPSGHIVHHGTPRPSPQRPTHEQEKEYHAAPIYQSLNPENREVVYIYRQPILRQPIGEIEQRSVPFHY